MARPEAATRCTEREGGGADYSFFAFFLRAPSTTAPASVIAFCSSPWVARYLISLGRPTVRPPTSSIGSSFVDVSRKRRGVRTFSSANK